MGAGLDGCYRLVTGIGTPRLVGGWAGIGTPRLPTPRKPGREGGQTQIGLAFSPPHNPAPTAWASHAPCG